MKNSNTLRTWVDASMLALLPSALAFRITGAELHEILGLATVAAFALHNVLNRAWYRSLGRGRYNADRSAGVAVVAAIAACAAACAVSGVALSGFVFGLSDRFGGLGVRAVHTSSAYWTFVLCGVHVGLRAGFLRFVPKIASAAVFCSGAYFFVSRGMPEKLFAGASFDFYEMPFAAYFCQTAAILFAAAFGARALRKLLRRR